MVKMMPYLAVIILIIGSIGAVAQPKDEKDNYETITLSFSELKITEENEYITIDLDETESILMEPNKPMLPLQSHTFTYPANTIIESVECTPINIEEKALTKEIKRAPSPMITSSQVNNKQSVKKLTLNSPYPDTWFKYRIGHGLVDDKPSIIVKVDVYPVQYYPSKSKVKVANEFNINIKLGESYQKTISRGNSNNFIILTPIEFSGVLEPLVTHKQNRGISTKIVTLDDIYSGTYFAVEGNDNAEKIKHFIKNAYENWNTRYVLLVGGAAKFPTRETHIFVNYNEGDDEVFVTDLYYADLFKQDGSFCSWDSNENQLYGEYNWGLEELTDEVDLFPDVHLCRLACVDSTDVETCVNKIITYESEEAYTTNWFTKIVVIGGDTAPNDAEGIDEGEFVNSAILNIMDEFIPDKIWDSNKRLSGYFPSGVTNIDDSINAGCGFLDWAGHGAPFVWTTYPHNGRRQSLPTPTGLYWNTDVLNLDNGNKLPIVLTGACSVAHFVEDPQCFTWSFVANPNGGGISAIGPSSLSWGYDTSYVIEDLGGRMQLSLFKSYNQYKSNNFGEMYSTGINEYIHADMDGGDYKTIQQWQPFGDPTLQIRGESNKPNRPQLNGPDSGKIDDEQTFTASTTDPDNDELYYLFNWGDGTYSSWNGPVASGTTVEEKHTWDKRGDYQVKVIARDENGVFSEWSVIKPISLPRTKTINTPLPKFLENYPLIYLLLQQLLLKN